MAINFREILGWFFDVDEVSANVYKVIGRDTAGRVFEKSGTDPDGLLEEAKRYALKVIAESNAKRV